MTTLWAVYDEEIVILQVKNDKLGSELAIPPRAEAEARLKAVYRRLPQGRAV